jgi:hypothetical protein
LALIKACGGRGFFVRSPSELEEAIKSALPEKRPVIINVMIEPGGKKKLVSRFSFRINNLELRMDVGRQGIEIVGCESLICNQGTRSTLMIVSSFYRLVYVHV